MILLIGLLFVIYFAGRPFYNLAAYHFKNKWVFAILGVVSYYVGLLIGAFLFGIGIAIISPDSTDNFSTFALNLIMIASGVVLCFSFYRILKSKWEADENNPYQSDDTVLDSNIGSNI